MNKVRVLVIDDSVFYRKILSDIIETLPDVEVIGTASNGKLGLMKIENQKPDLITLDIEMPLMDGVETLTQIQQKRLHTNVIMVSSLTKKGAEITIRCLEKGAFDFITKPESGDAESNIEYFKNELLPKIKAFANHNITKQLLSDINKKTIAELKPLPSIPEIKPTSRIENTGFQRETAKNIRLIAIGISTGGPNALAEFLPGFPADWEIPIVIVQHMPAIFTTALAESLSKKTNLKVIEAANEMPVEPNTIYIAPGGKQLKIEHNSYKGVELFSITDDPPENFCKPSVDYLFRSVAKIYGKQALGIIMTGMGSDGTLGLRLMKRAGSKIFAQDKESSVVFGMPHEAIKAGVVDEVYPLSKLASAIKNEINGMKS